MRFALSLTLLPLIVAVPLTALGQKVPVGPRFQVNTYTLGNQGYPGDCYLYGRRGQDVASDGSGSFVVVWSSAGQDGSSQGVFAQRYDDSGAPVGSEFQVNTYTTGYQYIPRVAVDGAGNFVVVWLGYRGDGYQGIYGRQFDSAGTPQGAEFQIDGSSTPYYEYFGSPAVGADASGNFVVSWDHRDLAAPGFESNYAQIVARRYDSTGSPQGAEFQVSQAAYYDDRLPTVSTNPGGDFVVAWQSTSVYYGDLILARRYDSGGSAQGNEFQVNTQGYFLERLPDTAADGSGNFVVTWESVGLDVHGYGWTDIAVRRYDSAGTPAGPEFRANTQTDGYQYCPSVAAATDGRFVVTWHSSYDYFRGFGQQFDSSGAPLGGEFLLNTDPTYYQALSTSVAASMDGDFVVVWAGYDDGSGAGVFGQRFGDGGPCTPEPKLTCRAQTKTRGAFRFRHGASPSRARLAWRWPTGESTTRADLGDPLSETDYALCVYDASVDPQPILQAIAPAGGTCGALGIQCWLEKSGPGPPVEYFDPDAASDGIRRIRLKPHDNDRTRIGVQGRGDQLSLPGTPLTAPVTVQLQATNDECFTATYDARIGKNEDGVFRARPGSPSGAFLEGSAAVLD